MKNMNRTNNKFKVPRITKIKIKKDCTYMILPGSIFTNVKGGWGQRKGPGSYVT